MDRDIKSKLRTCENCEWSCQHDVETRFLKCLFTGEPKGLCEYCDKFKEKTGEHFTIYY